MTRDKKYILVLEVLGRFTVWSVIFNYLSFIDKGNLDMIVVSLILMLWIINPIFNRER